MPFNESQEATEARLKELDARLSKTKDIREYQRLQTVRLWVSGYSYDAYFSNFPGINKLYCSNKGESISNKEYQD